MNAVIAAATGVFEWVLERSMQASLLIALLVIIHSIAGRWITAQWRYRLWLLVLGLLLLPVLPESRTSIYNLAHNLTPARALPAFTPAGTAGEADFLPIDPIAETDGPAASRNAKSEPLRVDFHGVAMTSWAIGVCFLFFGLAVVNARFARQVRRGGVFVPRHLEDLVTTCARELEMRMPIRLVRTHAVQSPAVMGWLRPSLLLPGDFPRELSSEEMRCVLLHELAHVKRGDLILNGFFNVVLCLHWFNPVVWYGFARMRSDRESACDAAVLSRTGEKTLYGETLIKLAEQSGLGRAGAGLIGIVESKQSIKRRLLLIAAFGTGTSKWPLFGGFLAVFLGVTFLTRAISGAAGDPFIGRICDRNGIVLAEIREDAGGERVFRYPFGAMAVQLLSAIDEAVLPQPGETVFLTLDARMQFAAEKALRAVPRGAAVILDPNDGGILAMASVPSFDPNAPGGAEGDPTKPLMNRALTAYAPGAAFLPVTGLAGITAGLGDASYTCNGLVMFGKKAMKCWIAPSGGGHGSQTLDEAMKHSCGPFFYQYGVDAGVDRIEAMSRALGLGAESGIPVQGEQAGLIPGVEWLKRQYPNDEWSPGYTANMSIGQGFVLATPLQMAAVAATIANGGTVHRPQLIEKVVSSDEGTAIRLPDVQARLGDLGIGETGIEKVRLAMWKTVNESGGSARRARVDGMEIAGRTGTAQNLRQTEDGRTVKDNHTWFVGFAPYEKPRYAFCIFVQGAKSGGGVPAPIAARILEEIERPHSEINIEPLQPAVGSFDLTNVVE